MTNLIDPEALRTRTLRQIFEDGVEEIYIGLFALAMGGFYLACFAIKGSTSSMAMLSVWESVWLAVVMLLVAARKKVKATYVAPRTGHVVFCRAKSQKRAVAIFGVSAIAFALALAIWRSHIPDLRPDAGLITGLLMGTGFLWAGVAYRFPHLNWIGVLALLLGIATYLTNAGMAGMVWVLFGVGAAVALSGAVRFRTFLRTHPIVEARHG